MESVEDEEIVIISELCATSMLIMMYTGELIIDSKAAVEEVFAALSGIGVSGVQEVSVKKKTNEED